MDSFSAFWDKINGPMYQNMPPPVKYDFAKYIDSITQGPVGNTEDGDAEFRTIVRSDTASHAAEDVLDWYKKYGRDLTKLGPEMTDAEFKKFLGHAW